MGAGCINNWTLEYTRFGMCKVFNPDKNRGETEVAGHKSGTEIKVAIGRKASLSVVKVAIRQLALIQMLIMVIRIKQLINN